MSKKIFLLLFLFLSCQLYSQNYIIDDKSDVEEVNVENLALQAYMADSTYFHDDDFRVSVVSKYADVNVYGTDLDMPKGKFVQWQTSTPEDSIIEIRITTSEHANYCDSITCRPVNLKAGNCTIYNLIPKRLYYYKVEEFQRNGTVKQLDKGRFKTTGQVRMIYAPGAHNMRDIGGWPTSFGKPIKYGRLYRSANLDVVQPNGVIELLDNLHLGAELDLRSESRLKASRLGDEVDFIRIVTGSYIGDVQSRGERFANDLQWIIARLRDGKNVDWHCAIGCDRCGTLTFLIEGLLGVSEVDLCRDYEISTFRGHKRFRSSGSFNKMITWMKTQGPEDNLAQCFYNYFINAGVSKADLDFLRTEMLDSSSHAERKPWWSGLQPPTLGQ